MKRALFNFLSRGRIGALGLAVIVAGSSLALSRMVVARDSTTKLTPVNLSVSETEIPRDGRFTTSFAPVIKRVTPSVVKVYVTTKAKTLSPQEMPFGGANNDFFRRFFGDQFNSDDGGRMLKTPPQHGLGSGVIIDKDGYILTNNHVVQDADNIRVALNDGREFTAKVVGRDPKTDIAILKIDAKNLPFVTIADSDKIEVGDLCLAIGNPFGVGQTVTMGIVSATGRGGLGTDYEDYIQTDAAINPGNSGGALVDAEGRLIGINTAILSRSGGYQGIGFAVPINMARSVMTSLLTNGRVVRGYMGVLIQDVTPELAREFKMGDDHGALVGDVTPRSPADKAGFKSGDVITDFNHKPVTDSRHLKLTVAETAPGSTVPVKILRDGKPMTLDVTVKELPGEQVAKAESSEVNPNDALDGVTVGDIDRGSRQQFGMPVNAKGALVTNVNQDSAAFEAGLRPGDVIEEINRKPVQNADDAVKLSENIKDKTILLKVWSKGGSHYVVVDESKAG
ncbi:MAG TPA: DegQ family serine endoprotease [Verrucomicrobiae bacterium]|nr:DegQ family serine endoprotease [Verrucomicrobiae bacterium]